MSIILFISLCIFCCIFVVYLAVKLFCHCFIIKYPDGSSYFGHKRNGLRDGKGKMRYANGDVYEGYWERDRREGNGTLYFSNGDIYRGSWTLDKIFGYGSLEYKNGDHYVGNWANGLYNGKGKMSYHNKSWYNGYWKNGKKNGKGVFVGSDGSKYAGGWECDKRSGKGKMIWYNKQCYSGSWRNDKFDGEGTLLYPDESYDIGVWKDGAFIKGKSVACARKDGQLSYFLKKGEISSTKCTSISDIENKWYKTDSKMYRLEIPYGNFHFVVYGLSKRIILGKDKHYHIISLGKSSDALNLIKQLKELSELYTTKSIAAALNHASKITDLYLGKENEYSSAYVREYGGDFCICWCWNEEGINYEQKNYARDSSKLKTRARYVQELVYEFNHVTFDKNKLVIDSEKLEHLKKIAKNKAIAKKVAITVGKKVVWIALGAFIGQNLDLDGDGIPDFSSIDGSDGLDDYSSISDSVGTYALPVSTDDLSDLGNIYAFDTNLDSMDLQIPSSDGSFSSGISTIDSDMDDWRAQSHQRDLDFIDSYNDLASKTERDYDDMIDAEQKKYEYHIEEAAKADTDYWRNYHKKEADYAKSAMDRYESSKRQQISQIKIDQSRMRGTLRV